MTPTAIRDVIAAGGPDIVYQPIVALGAHDTIQGYEALARFPDGKPPNLWFDAAWTEGLGLLLEFAAIQRAIEHFRPGLGYLAVNASPSSLLDDGLLELLQPDGLDVQVVVELSETQTVASYTALRYAMARLQEINVTLSIDDLGAGFSSMAHVLELEPESLKIDRRFTQKVPEDKRFDAIVAAIVAMAHALDVLAIAEGIESKQQRDGLRSLGCDAGQGWFLGVPGPLPEAT